MIDATNVNNMRGNIIFEIFLNPRDLMIFFSENEKTGLYSFVITRGSGCRFKALHASPALYDEWSKATYGVEGVLGAICLIVQQLEEADEHLTMFSEWNTRRIPWISKELNRCGVVLTCELV